MFRAFVFHFHLLALFLSSLDLGVQLAVGEVSGDGSPPLPGYSPYVAPPPPVLSGGYGSEAPPKGAEQTTKCPPAPVKCCNLPPPSPNPYVTNPPPYPYLTSPSPYPYGKYPPSYPYSNYPSPPYPYQYVPSSAPSMSLPLLVLLLVPLSAFLF